MVAVPILETLFVGRKLNNLEGQPYFKKSEGLCTWNTPFHFFFLFFKGAVPEVALSFDVGPGPLSIGIEVGKANPSVKSAGSRSKASVKYVFLVLSPKLPPYLELKLPLEAFEFQSQ